QEVQANIERLEKDLEHIIRQLPQWERQRRDEIRQLSRDTASYAVNQLIEETKGLFEDVPRVAEHIEAVRADLIEYVALFVLKGGEGDEEAGDFGPANPFARYEVNILVTQDPSLPGAPVIEELHPA